MATYPSDLTRHARNHDGVALPVALFALVAVTILVTSLLLSSATEVSLSAAHQDATRGLFTAEGAIEAYVAANGANLAPTPSGGVSYIPPDGTSRDEVTINVEVLGNVPNKSPTYASNALWNDTTYAITAAPRRGGRQVVAMIAKVMEVFTANIDAGMVSGDNVVVSGGAKLSDGSDSPIDPTTGQAICADTVGGKAVQTTTDAQLATTSGGGEILGENEKINLPSGELVKNIFGRTLDEMITSADIHLNSRDFTGHNVGKVTSLGGVGTNPMQQSPLNWGCPADIFVGCETDADLTRLPIVAINAASTVCTKVKGVEKCDPDVWNTAIVDMSHGQGILIVYNGNFHVAGQFAYKGIILVEGSFIIDGRGSTDPQNAPKVEGAVIGLGLNRDGTQSTVSDNTAAGNSTVRYNRCAISLVTQQMQQSNPVRRMRGRTFGWFEVVR